MQPLIVELVEDLALVTTRDRAGDENKAHLPDTVRMRISARVGVSGRVGVSAQGCGKKGGSKWFNSNTAQDSVRRLRPLRQGWAICPAFYAVKHAVLQGLVSRAPLLYFGPASVGARKQLADI